MAFSTRNFGGHLGRFCRKESGAISILNIYFTITLAIFGGIAIDIGNLMVARNQLQVAADVAAHAAMQSRRTLDADASKAKALEYARANVDPNLFGNVLQIGDIQFGTYDRSTKTFLVDNTSTEAVFVATNRLAANANPVSSFLLQLVGYASFDVRTSAVFVNSRYPCMGDGFFANGRVDMQSNNDFLNGFCIHSNSRVEFNNNNFFEHDDGVTVSMPSPSDLVIPGSGFSQNPGLQQSLHYGTYPMDVDALVVEIRDGITDPSSDHYRSFVTNSTVLNVSLSSGGGGGNGGGGNGNGNGNGNGGGNNGGGNNGGGSSGGGCSSFGMSCLTPGRIHEVSCSGNTLNVAGETYEDVVVITDCDLTFGNGTRLINATFITESTDDRSIKSPQGLQIGEDDSCAAGGDAQLVTFGGMKTAAKMQLYGGQIVAVGDVNFAAQGNGFSGASVIAGGEIDGTSNSVLGACPNVGEHFETPAPPRMAG
ncbi:MAG: hypothetical protein HKN18_11230 [Silicimonas sp.]|nr:hypothetical protein [Silicimonas sp.]